MRRRALKNSVAGILALFVLPLLGDQLLHKKMCLPYSNRIIKEVLIQE